MNVEYRARALEDIQAIYQWRVQHSTVAANEVEAAIFDAAEWLGDHPELGTRTDEMEVRRWPMTEFRCTIFYVFNTRSRSIEVIRVLDGRRVRELKRAPL